MNRFVPCCFVLVSLAACSVASGDDNVHAKADILGQTSSALSSSAVTAINGAYGATCSGHTDGEAWSLGANGNSTLAHPALSVRKNDTACSLSLTSIEAGGSTYTASSAMTLATSWAGAPTAFDDGDSTVDFYGNAMADDLSFSADFTISVNVTGDDNVAQTATKQGQFATQSASVSASSVPAPNYSLDMTSFSMQTDVGNVVQSSSGYAQLALESQDGQDYAVYDGTLTSASSLAEIAAAYSGATYHGLLSSLTSLEIPAAQFSIDGVDLDSAAYRTVIIRNTDAATNVVSYQLILVSFTHP